MNMAFVYLARKLFLVLAILFLFSGTTLFSQTSIFTSQLPSGTGDDGDYELGTKFTTSQIAQVTKIKYYKTPGETGLHTGKIWNSFGDKLIEVNFVSETPSGWQYAELTTPLLLFPGDTYIVSVNANTEYAFTPNELSSIITNGILSSVADNNNGVFNETPELFPFQSFNNSNYYRDLEVEALNNIFVSQIPSGSFNDGPYEMGVKFSSSQAAEVKALSYYKVVGETGSHTGNLWSSTGTLLASVTFTNETSGGWQYAFLNSPVYLNANTTYVVSVNSNTAYGASANGALDNPITNGVLSTIADNDNGVFGSPATFPTGSYLNTNYFRDIVVEPIYIPSAPTLLSPVDGSTQISIEPLLEWASVSGADTYEVEVATDAGFSNIIFSQTGLTANSVSLSELDNLTTYFWRVRAVNFAGLGNYSSASFTTVKAHFPYLSNPVGGLLVYTETIKFSWYMMASSAGLKFDLIYSTDPGFSSSTTISDIEALSVEVPGLLRGTDYYWKVRSKISSGAIASYSDTETFSTSGGAVKPIPSYPLNNDIVYSYSPTLYWYIMSSGSGLTYEIEFTQGNSGALTGTPTHTNISALNFQLTGLSADTEYSWQVRSKYGSAYSDWSTPITFKTVKGADEPKKPILSWPINEALIYSTSVQLNWFIATESSGLTYDLEIVNGETTALTGTATHTSLNSNSLEVTGLTNGERYSWAVRSTNGTQYSNWSDPETFEIVGGTVIPTVPIPSYPINGVNVYTDNVKLSWFLNSSYAGLTFELEFTTGTLTGTPNVTGLLAGNYNLTNLNAGTNYKWRVRSSNGTTTSAWSATQTFKTINLNGGNTVSVPVLSWPIGGATVYNTSPRLLWYHNEPAVNLIYELQYSTSSTMSSPVTVPNISNRYYDLSGLNNGTIYYWRVRSFNGLVYSNYSATTSFVTVGANGWVQPIAAQPSGGVIVNTASPQLSWFVPSANEVASFDVEISKNSDMSESKLYHSTANFEDGQSFEAGETYFWRVRSNNDKGESSDFSEVSSFSIPSDLTSLDEEKKVFDFSLQQNYPNPFNPSTTFEFSIAEQGVYSFNIYNLLGERVAILLNQSMSPGIYSINYDASNLSSGIYIYTLIGNKSVLYRKMLLIK